MGKVHTFPQSQHLSAPKILEVADNTYLLAPCLPPQKGTTSSVQLKTENMVVSSGAASSHK